MGAMTNGPSPMRELRMVQLKVIHISQASSPSGFGSERDGRGGLQVSEGAQFTG